MARSKSKSRDDRMEKSVLQEWASLTWDDLTEWAGSRSVSRGKAYQRQGRVADLSMTDDGRLLASVDGTERYATSARLLPEKGKRKPLDSECTCPVGASGCKHAVAVVAELLAAIVEGRPIPAADPDDRRWGRLAGETDSEFDDEDDFEDWESAAESAPQRKRKKPVAKSRRTTAEWDRLIHVHLVKKNQQSLVELVEALTKRFPELRQEFQERILLDEGDVDRLVAAARKEMRTVTQELGWSSHWGDEGHTPDYSRLKHKLERLVELSHSDRVVELGRELLHSGIRQVSESNDEGETASELSDCLEVIFAAVEKSSLAPADKILYAIDACLDDDYDILGEGVSRLLDAKWSADVWGIVVERLADRLQQKPTGNKDRDFSRDYRRECLTNFLADALERAGRGHELESLYETEARETGSYERLVTFLMERKDFDAAIRWACEGIEKSHEKLPGISSNLANTVCEIAKRRKQWDIVAAHAAVDFFRHPSADHFVRLISAAKAAGCEEAVRSAAQRFLETGESLLGAPPFGKQKGKSAVGDSWPLPLPDYLQTLTSNQKKWHDPRPHFDVLLDIAVRAKKPDDVLRWYEAITGQTKKGTVAGRLHWNIDHDKVAKAVAATYPDRALAIYRQKLDSFLPQADMAAYETCVDCLRAMRAIYKQQDREDCWSDLLANIREKYRNRPRFIEKLDQLAGRTIVQSLKSSGRR